MVKRADKVEVKVGQLWRDCDKRQLGRLVRVHEILRAEDDRVTDDVAVCIVEAQAGKPVMNPTRRVRIALRRMYPHSTGYELMEDAHDLPRGGDVQ